MHRLLMLAAACALATPPAAQAAPTLVGTTCGMVGLASEQATGQSTEALLFGAATAVDTGTLRLPTVEVRCWVTVNGTVVDDLGPGSVSLPGAAVFVARSSLRVEDTDAVKACTRIVVDGTTRYSGCAEATRTDVPPGEICDLVLVCDVTGQVLVYTVEPDTVGV